jgi:hypothetical protein
MTKKISKVVIITAIAAVLIAGVYFARRYFTETDNEPLVRIDLKDYGYTDRMAKAEELERNGNTSKIKVVQERGSSVGNSMFVMMAVCEVAKARNYEYFTNLKEWNDEDGGRIYIVGFTNKKDADIKKEFGEQYNYENDFGQKRDYMSVSQMKPLFEK